MDKFKAFLQENKTAIDGELPDDSAWENIAGRIGHTQQLRRGAIRIKLGKIAAAAAILAAVWLVYDQYKQPGSESALPGGSAAGVAVRDTPAGNADRNKLAERADRITQADSANSDKLTERADRDKLAERADRNKLAERADSDKQAEITDRNKQTERADRNKLAGSANSGKGTTGTKEHVEAEKPDVNVAKAKTNNNDAHVAKKSHNKPGKVQGDCTLLADLDKIDKKILAAFNSPLLKENASCSTTLKTQFASISEREKQIRLYVDCKTENNLDHLLIIQQQKLFLLRQTEEQIRKMAIYADHQANIINSI